MLLVQPGGQAAVAGKPAASVPLCRGVTLSASYLSALGPGKGPGFQFSLVNNTEHEIRMMEPVPSSAHWYALSKVHDQDRWLWRASNGAGGSLMDATNEHGPLAAYQSSHRREASYRDPSPSNPMRADSGLKARSRILSSNTNRAVRSALIRASASIGWSLLTHIFRRTRKIERGFSTAACARIRCLCRRSLDGVGSHGFQYGPHAFQWN